MQNTKNEFYNHYIALDWAKENFALASIRANGTKFKVEEYPSKIKTLKECMSKFSGKKILTIEETTTAHWLYVELFDHVDKILICEPFYNSLLKSGPKNDKIDAVKLCTLLRNGSLKEVFHTTDELYSLRKIVSSYEDFTKASVRLKNQRSAMFLSVGKDHKKEKILSGNEINLFVTKQQNLLIEQTEGVRNEYVKIFRKLKRENPTVSQLNQVPGIAEVLSVAILSVVIDANRFEDKYK